MFLGKIGGSKGGTSGKRTYRVSNSIRNTSQSYVVRRGQRAMQRIILGPLLWLKSRFARGKLLKTSILTGWRCVCDLSGESLQRDRRPSRKSGSEACYKHGARKFRQ